MGKNPSKEASKFLILKTREAVDYVSPFIGLPYGEWNGDTVYSNGKDFWEYFEKIENAINGNNLPFAARFFPNEVYWKTSLQHFSRWTIEAVSFNIAKYELNSPREKTVYSQMVEDVLFHDFIKRSPFIESEYRRLRPKSFSFLLESLAKITKKLFQEGFLDKEDSKQYNDVLYSRKMHENLGGTSSENQSRGILGHLDHSLCRLLAFNDDLAELTDGTVYAIYGDTFFATAAEINSWVDDDE